MGALFHAQLCVMNSFIARRDDIITPTSMEFQEKLAIGISPISELIVQHSAFMVNFLQL